jgi:hypothetical protein
MVPKV